MPEFVYVTPEAYDEGDFWGNYDPAGCGKLNDLIVNEPQEAIVEILRWKGNAVPEYFEKAWKIDDVDTYLEELKEEGVIGRDDFEGAEEARDYVEDLFDE